MTKKYIRQDIVEIVEEFLIEEDVYDADLYAEIIVSRIWNEGIFDPNQVEGA